MSNINALIEIAEFLQNEQLRDELLELQAKLQQSSVALHIPLVGEFSAGKTSLLNALTDAQNLEVATLPTTATIYELHFGAERNYAVVVGTDGELTEVADIASLRNTALADTPLVRIYDTSTRVPNDLVILDTPGISSPDVRHREVLVKTLPYTDALFLVVDCNQQITKSLTRFIEEATLAGRKTYLIISKCDTKHQSDIESIKQYIAQNNKLPLEQMACVSAQTGNLDEFYALIERIKADKRSVIEASVGASLQRIQAELKQNIEVLLSLPNDAKGLEDSLDALKRAERDSRNEIDSLMSEVRYLAERTSSDSLTRFEQMVNDRLNTLLAKYSDTLTYDANSAISSTADHILSSYRNSLERGLQSASLNYSEPLKTAVQRLDLSEVDVAVVGFSFNLENIGHSWDKNIAKGIQFAAVAAVVAATIIPTAGGSAAVAAGGVATNASKLASVADTVTDVASMSRMAKLQRTMERTGRYIQKGMELKDQFVTTQNQIIAPQSKGMLEGLVGKVSELGAKPKRQRAVREALEGEILPNFKLQMQHNSELILSMLQSLVSDETAIIYNERRGQIEVLKQDLNEQREAYDKRISQLKAYLSQVS